MAIKTGLNIAVLKWSGNLDTLLFKLRENGIEGVEFPIQLWLKTKSKITHFGNIHCLGVSGILHKNDIFPQSIFINRTEYHQQILLYEEKLRTACLLGCKNISLGIDPWVKIRTKQAEQKFISRVVYLAEKARAYGININLEYIAPQLAYVDAVNKYNLFCGTLNNALDLIDKIKLPNVKLLLDFFHWYVTENKPNLRSYIKQVGFIHIADCLETEKQMLTDQLRVLPFEGRLPLQDFLTDLITADYSGPLTIEVFRSTVYQPSFNQIIKSYLAIKSRLEAN